MADEEDWLPLNEAVLTWGGPALTVWIEMARTVWDGAHDEMRVTGVSVDDLLRKAEEEGRLKHLELQSRDVDAEFIALLAAGELIAKGRRWWMQHGLEHIEPDQWNGASVDRGMLSMSNDFFTFVDIRVRPASPQATQTLIAPAPAAGASTPSITKRGRGRPSIMPMIKDEFARRAERDDVVHGLAAQARVLQKWAAASIQGEKIPQAESISEAISQQYREYRAQRKT